MKQFKGIRTAQSLALFRRVMEVTSLNQIPLFSAHACYFMVLAAFPGLLLVLGILRYTPLEVADLTSLLEGLLPAALMPAVTRLISSTYSHTSTAIVSVSALAALWSASRSIYGLVIGLITPPVGNVLYIGMGITKITLLQLLKKIWPMVVVYMFTLFLITIFPQLVMFLPNLVVG